MKYNFLQNVEHFTQALDIQLHGGQANLASSATLQMLSLSSTQIRFSP